MEDDGYQVEDYLAEADFSDDIEDDILISTSIYNLKKNNDKYGNRRFSHVVEVGLSAKRDFKPMVKVLCIDELCKPTLEVFFTEQDWYDFHTSRAYMIFENFASKWNKQPEKYVLVNPNISITFKKDLSVRYVDLLCNGSGITLSEEEFRCMYTISNLVIQKLDTMKHQGFYQFYGQFVSMMREAVSLNSKIDIEFYTRSLCQTIASENNLTMMELLYVYPQGLIADVKEVYKSE